jgi:hypothetical protein
VYLEAALPKDTFDFEWSSDLASLEKRAREVLSSRIDRHEVVVPPVIQIPGKFNKYIPNELLVKQYLEDYLKDVAPCL